jgi:exopolysaccharide biosynthesis operon protein EpsL
MKKSICLGLLCIFCPAHAHGADDDPPMRFFAGIAMVRDSNIFRLSDAADAPALIGSSQKDDTIRRLSAGARIAVPVSRQRFSFDAALQDDDYSRFRDLSYRGGHALGNWKWQAGEDAFGELQYGYERVLAGFGEQQRTTRDVVTSQGPGLKANYRLDTQWTLAAELARTQSRHSDPVQAVLDTRTSVAGLGVNYATRAENSVGVQIKFTNANFPNRELGPGSTVDNRYRQVDTGVVADWRIAGASRLNGFLGYTTRRHKQFSERDFSGGTGRINGEWAATGKLRFNLSAWREIGSVDDLTASYVVATGASIAPVWAVTDMVGVETRFSHEQRTYRGNPGLLSVTTAQRDDNVRTARIGLSYKPRRSVDAGVAYEIGKRTSNEPLFDYRYNQLGVELKLNF